MDVEEVLRLLDLFLGGFLLRHDFSLLSVVPSLGKSILGLLIDEGIGEVLGVDSRIILHEVLGQVSTLSEVGLGEFWSLESGSGDSLG